MEALGSSGLIGRPARAPRAPLSRVLGTAGADARGCAVAGTVAAQMIRAAIGAALMYVGCLYLLNTLSVTDLILNAMALEFVVGPTQPLRLARAPPSGPRGGRRARTRSQT